ELRQLVDDALHTREVFFEPLALLARRLFRRAQPLQIVERALVDRVAAPLDLGVVAVLRRRREAPKLRELGVELSHVRVLLRQTTRARLREALVYFDDRLLVRPRRQHTALDERRLGPQLVRVDGCLGAQAVHLRVELGLATLQV